MSYRIVPRTPAGERLIAAANGLRDVFRERSEGADRANEICAENYTDMQAAGIMAAFVPEELGGMGLRSIHDWILAIATLAKGDGSAAIAISSLSFSLGVNCIYNLQHFGRVFCVRRSKIGSMIWRSA